MANNASDSMSRLHRNCLCKIAVEFGNHLRLTDKFYTYMLDFGLCSDEQKEMIKSKSECNKQEIRMVISHLQKRGNTAYDLFIQCLRNTSQSYLANRMVIVERAIRSGSYGTLGLHNVKKPESRMYIVELYEPSQRDICMLVHDKFPSYVKYMICRLVKSEHRKTMDILFEVEDLSMEEMISYVMGLNVSCSLSINIDVRLLSDVLPHYQTGFCMEYIRK